MYISSMFTGSQRKKRPGVTRTREYKSGEVLQLTSQINIVKKCYQVMHFEPEEE